MPAVVRVPARQGPLVPVLLFVLALAGSGLSQGPLKRERWAYTHLEWLRTRVAAELQGRDLQTRREVVTAVERDAAGIPFLPWVRALAVLRGKEADPAFVYRTMLCAFPLPEVVDPDSDNPECTVFNLSLFQPYTIEQPGNVEFEVVVRDASGDVLWRGDIERDTAMDDLRMARPVAEIPGRELPDGSYRVSVRAYIDGAAPREGDPVLEHGFHVLRGYQKRAESAMQRVSEKAGRLPAMERALLVGLTLGVSRPYSGEPFDVRSTALRDLEHVERALDNLEARRPLLRGIHGTVTLGLPVREVGQYLLATLRLPDGEPLEKPLVVFVSGSPSYDGGGHRPGSPVSRYPAWLAAGVFEHFADDGEFQLAVLESPGRLRDSIAALADGLDALTELLEVPEGRVALVAEREGAVLAGLGVERLVERISGLVLVAGGSLSKPALQAAGDLPILGLPVVGHPSSQGLIRTNELVEGRYGAVDFRGRWKLVPDDGRTWATAVLQSLPEIEEFVRVALLGR